MAQKDSVPRITSGSKAAQLLVDVVFDLLKELDELRSSHFVPSDFEEKVQQLISVVSGGASNDLSIFSDFADSQKGFKPSERDRDLKSMGWLDDATPFPTSPPAMGRTWSSPRSIHSACWVSHIMGAIFAIKDGLSEIEDACYRQEPKEAKHGPTLTRNLNWKRKRPGRPTKAKNLNKFKRPPGRPIDKNSDRQRAKTFGAWEQRRQWRERQRKHRRKIKRQQKNAAK